ncbi:hypothetical protein P9112_012191 [Eukaryota sp. TZLM1-RC]
MDGQHIFHNIYLAAANTAFSINFLREYQISGVLSVAAERFIPKEVSSLCKSYHLRLLDLSSQDIITHQTDILSFYDSINGNIVINCNQGVSRAPSVVLMILMLRHNFNLAEAYQLVHSKRPNIRPNLGFMNQLCKLEVAQFRTSVSSMDMFNYTFEYVCYLLSAPHVGRPFIRAAVRRHSEILGSDWIAVQDAVLTEFFGVNWQLLQ